MEFTKKVQGKADIELNEKGIQQAETTRDSLKEIAEGIVEVV